jgi:sulfur relay (sulfurtransferase) DsrC/TusE family protein
MQKMEINITMKRWEILNLIRTDKYLENNIESAAHTVILKQQNQLNGRNHHIPLNTSTQCLLMNSTFPLKDTI